MKKMNEVSLKTSNINQEGKTILPLNLLKKIKKKRQKREPNEGGLDKCPWREKKLKSKQS